MESLASVAIDSVNYLIDEQRSLNGNSRVSLLLFNNKVETIRDAVPLSVAGLIKSIGAHSQGQVSPAPFARL